MSKLINIMAAGGVSAFLAGCTTTSFTSASCMGGNSVAGPLGSITTQSFSQKCADNVAAATMLKSGRPDLQLLGTTILRNESPAVEKAAQDVMAGKAAALPDKGKKDCKVTEVEKPTTVADRNRKPKTGKEQVSFQLICG